MPGVVNGTEYYVNIEGKYIIGGTGANISFTTGTKDLSCRETENWKKISPAMREWTMEFEGKFMYVKKNFSNLPSWEKNTTFAIYEGWEKQIASYSRKLFIELYTNQATSMVWLGYAYLTSSSIEAPNEDSSSVKLSFKGAGAPYYMTV